MYILFIYHRQIVLYFYQWCFYFSKIAVYVFNSHQVWKSCYLCKFVDVDMLHSLQIRMKMREKMMTMMTMMTIAVTQKQQR